MTVCPINEWERTFDIELIGEWEPKLWNTKAFDGNHPEYTRTINSIKEVIDQY